MTKAVGENTNRSVGPASRRPPSMRPKFVKTITGEWNKAVRTEFRQSQQQGGPGAPKGSAIKQSQLAANTSTRPPRKRDYAVTCGAVHVKPSGAWHHHRRRSLNHRLQADPRSLPAVDARW